MSSTLMHSVPDSRPYRASLRVAPVVAVTSTADALHAGAHRVRLNSAYVNALENAGLIPLVIPPLSATGFARAIIERVDGVVLTGGEDVDPSLYGQARHPKCGEPNPRRDQTEIAIVQAARDARIPVFAICRGPQLLNVALGGALIQDIPSQVGGALQHHSPDDRSARVHDIDVEPGSLIAAAVGAERITVNSLHHQAVSEVAPGLRVTARAPDGIVEGLESASPDWWVLAVQWHPEEMEQSSEPWDRGLFRAFATRLTQD